MKAIFKPGDKVTFKHDKEKVMTVQKYARRYTLLLGWHENQSYLECTWFENNEYHREVFHQSVLTKYLPHYVHHNAMVTNSFSNKIR